MKNLSWSCFLKVFVICTFQKKNPDFFEVLFIARYNGSSPHLAKLLAVVSHFAEECLPLDPYFNKCSL